MNNLLLVALMITATFDYMYGQFECFTIEEEPEETSTLKSAVDFIPNDSTPIKYLRVNIHFMLRSPGDSAYPGNFATDGDGNGNPDYTGYDYAEDLVDAANFRLSRNQKMHLPPGNSTPVIARKYRYVLNGVFFHEDNNYYYFPSYPNGVYGENVDQCINVFIEHANGASGRGHASMNGLRYVEMRRMWERYVKNITENVDIIQGIWEYANLLNHEIGHNLSLHHTVRHNSGPCLDNKEDYCDDTPTRGQIRTDYGFDPCCDWNVSSSSYCSNNLMDYGKEDAITPEQLGRIHSKIENELKTHKTCFFLSPRIVGITSFTDNKAFIGERVLLPWGASVRVSGRKALYVNAEEFEIVGELEIDDRARLTVYTLPKCN